MHGALLPDLPAEPPGRTPVRRGALPLGTVVHADRAAVRRELEHLLVRAGLAMEIARLRVEVRRQLAEVEPSRSRIVSAAFEERRRLERDLHDGAQQRLVSIGLDLRHLQPGSTSGSPVRDRSTQSVAALAAAIRELRELAHGVRPSALDDGLAPALAELAARAPVPTRARRDRRAVRRRGRGRGLLRRQRGADQRAQARATPASSSARPRAIDGQLVVTVADDGAGGAVAGPGSGLAGMADRVAALGGTLRVDSPPAAARASRAELPCES